MKKWLHSLLSHWNLVRNGLTVFQAPVGWPADVKPDTSVTCPSCGVGLDVLKNIPVGARNATVVCFCREQVEVYPDRYFGWRKVHTRRREKSLA